MKKSALMVRGYAKQEVRRLRRLPDLVAEDPTEINFKKLYEQIKLEGITHLRAFKKPDHPEILREFAAEAGYMLGLEIGQRLAREWGAR